VSAPFDLTGKRVWVAGDRGMVGRAILRRLAGEGCTIVSPETRLDLRDQAATNAWMAAQSIDLIFLAAARVGGIAANAAAPGAFLYDNLLIAATVIEAARQNHVSRLVFLGSSCIYPKFAPQPMPESALLGGPLEPTNQYYAIAKIAGLKMCEAYRRQYGCDFIAAQPTNLYGPFDNFNLDSSHVLPALLRKAHDARLAGSEALQVWGSGTPRRELLHVDDLADALVFLAQRYSGDEFVNIGSGDEVSIGELAQLVANVVGFRGTLSFDLTRPDGTPRKLVDTTKLTRLGWTPSIRLENGIAELYRWFLEHDAGGDRRAAA
jgi:GDP-L-fucose synthase